MRILRFSPAGVVGTVVAFAVALTCVRLGIWQLERHDQRSAVIAALAERAETPPLRLRSMTRDTTGIPFRMVEVRGQYDDARSFVLGGRYRGGERGAHLVTPLVLDGGEAAVLVERGWVPSPDGMTVDPLAYATTGPVSVQGLALPFPYGDIAAPGPGPESRDATRTRATARVVYRLDAADAAARLPYPILPVYVHRLPEEGSTLETAPPLATLVQAPDAGPHLSYAVQWFIFASIAVVGWAVLVARRMGADR